MAQRLMCEEGNKLNIMGVVSFAGPLAIKEMSKEPSYFETDKYSIDKYLDAQYYAIKEGISAEDWYKLPDIFTCDKDKLKGISLLTIHGIDDQIIPFKGGQKKQSTTTAVNAEAIPSSLWSNWYFAKKQNDSVVPG